jgi:hypothetical protein
MSKGLLDTTTIMFLAGIVLIAVLAGYSSSKGTESFGAAQASGHGGGQASKKQNLDPSIKEIHQAADAAPSTQGAVVGADAASSSYASASGISSPEFQAPSCSKQDTAQPSDLLPSKMPAGATSFGQPDQPPMGADLLQAGHHIGIDTVGQSLRNANLQLRSEPPNPQQTVSPWGNSTIGPDLIRVPLEIGCGPQ